MDQLYNQHSMSRVLEPLDEKYFMGATNKIKIDKPSGLDGSLAEIFIKGVKVERDRVV